MTDTSHLTALMSRLRRERLRLAEAKTNDQRALRAVWVSQIEKEIAGEIEFLAERGVIVSEAVAADEAGEMTDDELLAELMA
jgi:predicted deacylase